MKRIFLVGVLVCAAFPTSAFVHVQGNMPPSPMVSAGLFEGGKNEKSSKDEVPPADDQRAAVEINGFRSARFGATEEELRPLIAKDLGVDPKDIRNEVHPVERTRSLVAVVENLLPDSGSAAVAYILGASSKRLMQVNVVWSSPSADKTALERMAGTANALRDHLLHKGRYAKDRVVANAKLPDGSILVFQGEDDKHRMVSLHLVVSPPNDDAEKSIGGVALRLSYIEKPGTPDVFKIAPSAF